MFGAVPSQILSINFVHNFPAYYNTGRKNKPTRLRELRKNERFATKFASANKHSTLNITKITLNGFD